MPNLRYIQRTGCNYGSRCVTKQIHVLSSRGKVWQRRSKVELSVWHNDWVAKNDLRNQENKFSKHTSWNMLYLVNKEFCCVFLCINTIVKNESSIFLKEGGTINRTIPHGGTVSYISIRGKSGKRVITRSKHHHLPLPPSPKFGHDIFAWSARDRGGILLASQPPASDSK